MKENGYIFFVTPILERKKQLHTFKSMAGLVMSYGLGC